MGEPEELQTKTSDKPKDDLRGRLIKVSIPDGNPILGSVTDLETGETLALTGLTLDIDMNRRYTQKQMLATLVAMSRTEGKRPIFLGFPVASVKEFSLTVRMDTAQEEVKENIVE